MLIPIPSQYKPLTVSLKLEANDDVIMGIWVYQPNRPNTHYFRRKVSMDKGELRTIQVPLPVSPNRLVLEIYDKRSSSDARFKLKDISIEPLNHKRTWASPERHRFMEFAIDFAQKAGYLKPGFYPSKDDDPLSRTILVTNW